MEDDAERKHRIEAAERVAGSISEEDAPWWRTPEDIDAWVRALRSDADDRTQDNWFGS